MDNSSPQTIDPSELYDGPVPDATVMPFPNAHRPLQWEQPPPDPRLEPAYLATLNAALDIVGARLLGLIALVAACLMWGWAVYDPLPLRTYAALGFSLTVLAPIIMLYWRRG
jgi:hypothetical protein